jgi:hypothetical protein
MAGSGIIGDPMGLGKTLQIDHTDELVPEPQYMFAAPNK